MSERVEQLKDVGMACRYQKTLKHVCTPTPSAIETEIIACENGFDEAHLQEIGLNLYAASDDKSKKHFDASEDSQKVERIVEVKRAFLKWLDIGSEDISLLYAGSGHGSKTSVCLSVLFGVGFVAFLIIFGVLKLDTTVNVYNWVGQDFSYKFRFN